MKVPLAWLREFVPVELPADELAELITLRGVKVEEILRPWDGLEGVVVAEVVGIRDHPNSDKLCLARVWAGVGEQEVVVGVRNMTSGDLVPFAPPGARVPGLPEPLSAREIRGVVSNGMLCSSRELAISQDHGGILLLNNEGLAVGDDVRSGLGLEDAVFDIEVEPNRPDFLSVYGVAREVSAITGAPLLPPRKDVDGSDEEASSVATVRIEATDGCPRYIGRVVRGISDRPSPMKVQARLWAAGMRPISAAVDATNYAMIELGQPLHGFDLNLLAGPGIVVRRAKEGERLTTLDDVERELAAEDLLICDLERPVAIAGVMGGATSEVSAKTTDVLIEAAYFTRAGILRTARRLDLHTEASHRFERGTDREALDGTAARCAKLMSEWAGGVVLRGATGAGEIEPRVWVSMRPSRAGALLGYPVGRQDAKEVFERLDMRTRDGDEEAIEVEVPGYRVDIEREVDLIEEVVRIQGYERVGSALMRSSSAGGMAAPYGFARHVRDVLVRAGLREVKPLPFASAEDIALTGDQDAIAVANPLRADESFMRTRLTPGILHTVARNQAWGARTTALFEVSTVFRLGEGDPVSERRKVAIAMSGPASEGWSSPQRSFDALDVRGVLESMMNELDVADWSLGDPLDEPFHPGRSATLILRGARAGVFGEIHPRVAEALGLTGRVAVAEIEFDALMEAAEKTFTFRDPPRFPPVHRDLAFVLDGAVPAGSVNGALREAGGDLIESVELFDVFTGGTLPEGSKSLAFSVDLRAEDRTLTDEEADGAVTAMAQRIEEEFGGQLRAG
jgi:phenylalanyl-tRNA synthetase beta chain